MIYRRDSTVHSRSPLFVLQRFLGKTGHARRDDQGPLISDNTCIIFHGAELHCRIGQGLDLKTHSAVPPFAEVPILIVRHPQNFGF